MTKTYTLVFYEQIPETATMYLIPDDKIDAFNRGYLKRAHNQIGNTVGWLDAVNFISAVFMPEKYKGDLAEDTWAAVGCMSSAYSVEGVPENTVITHVIKTGFML